MPDALKRLKNKLAFKKDFKKFKKLSEKNDRGFSVVWEDRYPCLNDKTSKTTFDSHYMYHPAWAARVLSEIKPKSHVDISSILHFSAIVSAFVPVEFYDFRPADLKLSNLTSKEVDLTHLPFGDDSIKSLSCMHAIEHIGLGRYGDPIDPDGDLRAIKELKRVLADGGNLLVVVPIGKPKIQFNAHRVYSYDQILDYFSSLKLKEFSLIGDNPQDGLIKNATKKTADEQTYGCGCFWFKK